MPLPLLLLLPHVQLPIWQPLQSALLPHASLGTRSSYPRRTDWFDDRNEALLGELLQAYPQVGRQASVAVLRPVEYGWGGCLRQLASHGRFLVAAGQSHVASTCLGARRLSP